MQNLPVLGTVFVGLAVIFLSLTIRDYLRSEGKLTPARRTWLRIALIFAAVGILQYFVHILLRER